MARFLALDWDAGHVHLLAATVAKGTLKLERALTWAEAEPPTSASGEAFGHRVRDRLKDAKIAVAPLLVAVGRDKLVLKEVRYPSVPAHEEPGVVRFQAVKELTDAPDDVVIDYQAAETPEPNGERKALAVALRKDAVAAYQAIARGLGVKLAAATPRAFGTVACLLRTANPAPEPGTAFAVLTVGPKGGEFAVARGENLAFARPVAGPALASDAALLGEVRRNLAVYAGQASQYPVRALYVAEAGGTLGVADRLRDTLAVPVYRFDPLAGLPSPSTELAPGAFAGAAGLLHLQSRGRALPVNFVSPREPSAAADPNKRTKIIAAATAIAVLIGLGALGYSRLAAKDAEIAELKKTKDEIDAELLARDSDDRRLKALDEWMHNQVVVLDELYELASVVQDPSKLRVTAFAVNPINATGKKKFPARIELKGLVGSDDAPVRVVQKELSAEPFYNVGNKVVGPNTGSSRQQFSQQWTLKYDAERRTPEKFLRSFQAAPPPRRERREGFNPIELIFGERGAP